MVSDISSSRRGIWSLLKAPDHERIGNRSSLPSRGLPNHNSSGAPNPTRANWLISSNKTDLVITYLMRVLIQIAMTKIMEDLWNIK